MGPFSFAGLRVSEALRRIAAAVNAMMRVKPDKSVDMFQTLPTSNALSIGNSSDVRSVVYESSLAQVRTRTYFAGGGSQTTALVQATATTIPVEECGWHVSGTQVLVGSAIISYTGVSATSGPGNLTGCSGLTRGNPAGRNRRHARPGRRQRRADRAGHRARRRPPGVAVGWFSDGRLSYGEAAARSTSDVAFYKEAIRRWPTPPATATTSPARPCPSA